MRLLEPLPPLGQVELEAAMGAAMRNARELLEEAALLRKDSRCARAYLLAHIACEELGKLPVLMTTALRVVREQDVDWKWVDQTLRSHPRKVERVMFMDYLVDPDEDIARAAERHARDLGLVGTYNDLKNASLYSCFVEGEFKAPSALMDCEFFDTFETLARARLAAFERIYIEPVRRAGNLAAFLSSPRFVRIAEMVRKMMAEPRQEAFREYQETGDPTTLREWWETAVGHDVDDEVAPEGK